MTAPQDDPALIGKLAAMTHDELTAVLHAARGVTDSGDEVKRMILHALHNPKKDGE